MKLYKRYAALIATYRSLDNLKSGNYHRNTLSYLGEDKE